MNNRPYLPQDIDNITIFEPWLMNESCSDIITINDLKLTASNIWNCSNREDLLKEVFDYYRQVGFPYDIDSTADINKTFKKLKTFELKKCAVNEETKIMSNNSTVGLDVCRHYNRYEFWNAKGDDNSRSIVEAFNDDNIFIDVLKNRMGWCTSNEGGQTRPYVFSIYDKMIIQGIRSSAKGYGVSNFRPMVARYFALKYKAKNILDYSAGWGARMLGCCSVDSVKKYTGIDPLTADNINQMIDDLNLNNIAHVIKGCSEDNKIYNNLNDDYDLVISCPPYFTLEKYSNDNSQSYNKFNNYKDWINEYWNKTVENCYCKMINSGIFILFIKDNYKKFDLLNDMKNICLNNGLKFIDEYSFNTVKSHLSGKSKTKITNKNSEKALIFEK